jgi:hypothetical protein
MRKFFFIPRTNCQILENVEKYQKKERTFFMTGFIVFFLNKKKNEKKTISPPEICEKNEKISFCCLFFCFLAHISGSENCFFLFFFCSKNHSKSSDIKNPLFFSTLFNIFQNLTILTGNKKNKFSL